MVNKDQAGLEWWDGRYLHTQAEERLPDPVRVETDHYHVGRGKKTGREDGPVACERS